jgi:hypothetical protein
MSLSDTGSGDVVVVRRAVESRPAASEYWPINWSAIWVGALSALAVALIVSLVASALGAQQFGGGGKIAKWSDVGLAALVFAILGSFFSFVVGGWVAGKINGFRRAETDMLHGAIVWLLTLPLFVGLAAVGAGTLFGSWFGGLAGVPVWATQTSVSADPNAAAAARNAALFAVTALLIGLVGAVLGGWMASGEPMSLRLRSRAASVRHETSRSAV